MAKDWDRYKSEIQTLYITKGKSLDDVRRILKGRRNFDASVRAYRMKFDEWGVRKNKVSSRKTRGGSRQPLKTTSRNPLSLETRSSNLVSAPSADSNILSLRPEPNLQFQNQEAWASTLHFNASDGENLNSSSLATARALHENLAAPYLDTNEEMDFAPSDQILHEAISHGTEEEITNLLSSGVPINTRDNVNNSPLHTAISRGSIGIVKSLLNYGANVDAIGFKRKTPLHLAAASKGLVQLLLKHHPTLSLQDDEGNTILHYMLFIKDWWVDLDVKKTIKTILSSGADINMTNKLGESPLHRLVADVIPESSEYMDMVSEFLRFRPNVTSPMRNSLALFGVFLDNSNILSMDHYYRWDCRTTGIRCLEQFLAAGADPNIMFHSEPLVNYCLGKGVLWKYDDSTKFLMSLLQRADIGVAGSGGNYPLHLAARTMSGLSDKLGRGYAVIAALIARKANVNQTNASGASPLEILLDKLWRPGLSAMRIVPLFVKAGAATIILTSTGKTLFDLLAKLPKAERICLIKALLEANINSQQDDSGFPASPEWAEIWRAAWKQSVWHLAKHHLAELGQNPSRPKIKEFDECALIVIAENLLKRHKSQLELWQRGDLEKESVRENYEDYCAILRDCHERQITVGTSWYAYLLDLMDFRST